MTEPLSVQAFLEHLATASPTPGGGSVAALAGATGAGLISMVCHLTLPKTEDGDRIERLTLASERADELRLALTTLIERDANSYDAVIAAYRLPKDNDDQQRRRRTMIQEALKVAAAVPAETARSALEVLELALEIAPDTSRNAISDIAVAAHMGFASFASAEVNVRINLGAIRDRPFVERLSAQLRDDQSRAAALHEATVRWVHAALRQAESYS